MSNASEAARRTIVREFDRYHGASSGLRRSAAAPPVEAQPPLALPGRSEGKSALKPWNRSFRGKKTMPRSPLSGGFGKHFQPEKRAFPAKSAPFCPQNVSGLAKSS